MAGSFVVGVDLQIQNVLGIQNLKQQLAGININANTTGLNNTAAQLQNVGKAAAAVSPPINAANTNINNLNNTLTNTAQPAARATNNLNNTGKAAQTFGDQVSLAGRRYAAFVIATSAAFKAIDLIGDGVRAIVDFESALIRLDQILDEGSARINSLKQQFLDLSVATGTSASDLAEVATLLAQAGLGDALDSALEPLSRVPLLPAFESITTATEGVIVVMNQFGLEANNTAEIIDLLNETANKFAVTSEDIIEGVKRGGAAFAATGGDLKEFIALFTTIRQVTQLSAETVGTAIKTISARVFTPSVTNFLQKEGIQVVDSLTGEFAGLNNILLEVGRRFETLSVPRQAEFARQLGGVRQIGQIFAALRNPQIFEQVDSALSTASGSATKDANKALESTATQLKILAAEAEKLAQVLAPSLFLPVIQGLTSLGSIAVKVIDQLSPLLPLLTGIAGVAITRQLAGLTAGLASKALGGLQGTGGGALGANIQQLLFGSLGQFGLQSNTTQTIQRRLGLQQGTTPTNIVSRAQGTLNANPLIGVGATAVLGTLTANLLETQTSVNLLGDETAKTASNVVQFGTALIAAIALLRGQSITQAFKSLFSGFGGGAAGLLGGGAALLGIVATAYADAVNETTQKMIDDSIEQIRKVKFTGLNVGTALTRTQEQLGLLSSTFINSEGFQRINATDFTEGQSVIDDVGALFLTIGSHIDALLNLDTSLIKAGISGSSVEDVGRQKAITQFVEANLQQLTELFDNLVKQNVGDARNAFVAGLQRRAGVTPEAAQQIADEFESQSGGKAAVNERIKQVKTEQAITTELNRVNRDLATIIVPTRLTGQLLQFSKAVDLTTSLISASATSFNAQIATIQGIGGAQLNIQPTERQVLDSFQRGDFNDLFANQPDIPNFVNGITEIGNVFDQFVLRMSNLDLANLSTGDIETNVSQFLDEQNVPTEVRDKFNNFFNEVGISLQESITGSFLSPGELKKQFDTQLKTLGAETQGAIVEQTTQVIQSIFTQIEDRANRLATLRRLELESNVLPESQAQFLIDQLKRVGIGTSAVPTNQFRGTIAQFDEEQRRRTLAFGDRDIADTPSEGFFRDFSSQLKDIVLDDNVRNKLKTEFLSVTDEISKLRNSLQTLSDSGQDGSETFIQATERLDKLTEKSIELQATFEALRGATDEARQSAIEELSLRQDVERRRFTADLQSQVDRGRISPELAQSKLFDFQESQIKERQELDRTFAKILQEDGERRLELARIINENTATEVDATTIFQNAVAQFGQSVISFQAITQAGAVRTQENNSGIGITPEQIRSGAVTPQQVLEATNQRVIELGRVDETVQLLRDVMQEVLNAKERSGTPTDATQSSRLQNKDAQTKQDPLIERLDTLNKNLEEPGSLNINAEQQINVDFTGLPGDVSDEISAAVQELATRIATNITRNALDKLAENTDIETAIAIKNVTRELA